MASPHDKSMVERKTLCVSGSTPGVAVHAGEAEFQRNVTKHFSSAENNIAERLIDFKSELRNLDSESFWNHLMEGLASLCNAQFAFVSKRILVDDQNAAVEMPPIGEVGSCLMGVALYWNDGKLNKNLHRDYKYYAWDAPCSYMRHDKVFLVPEGLSSFVTKNPNQLPFECDAYLGIPLFADGKCFAHFGLMWTAEGLELKRGLSWGYLEMVLHTMEDMIADRLISGTGFAKVNQDSSCATDQAPAVIPQSAITAAQSLRPYARSLSHELRTPMQGVVGMLDVMHATVQEQIEGSSSSHVRKIFQALKSSIETVQDSSKRAVEAADNVVQAYDLNMELPDTPSHDIESLSSQRKTGYFDSRPMMKNGSSIVNPSKRKRSTPNSWNDEHAAKLPHLDPDAILHRSPNMSPLTRAHQHLPSSVSPSSAEFGGLDSLHPPLMTPADTEGVTTPLMRQSNIRDLLPLIIHDSLRVGGRPDSAISELTLLGEKIEVRSRSSNGHASRKLIEWSVDTDVPDTIAVDERDVTKVVAAVFLNAVKFTEDGSIALHVRMSGSRRSILINVTDTGSGIPEGFQPELFKPFAKEDNSITRSKEGLGLGLLVAKGVARRIGGDIVLVRSSTDNSDQGSEFEIRLPIELGERTSRCTTPFNGTPRLSAIKTSSDGQVDDPASSPFLPISPINAAPTLFPTANKTMSTPSRSDAKPALQRRFSTTSQNTITAKQNIDKDLATKHPLRILVAEDNKINRKLLVNMLHKLGYSNIHEAFDGKEAVRVMESLLHRNSNSARGDTTTSMAPIDVVLMDLWMPEMDGYEATEKILRMFSNGAYGTAPTVLAVSADVTEAAVERASKSGMQGYMTKPYKMIDLQRLILEFCAIKA